MTKVRIYTSGMISKHEEGYMEIRKDSEGSYKNSLTS